MTTDSIGSHLTILEWKVNKLKVALELIAGNRYPKDAPMIAKAALLKVEKR